MENNGSPFIMAVVTLIMGGVLIVGVMLVGDGYVPNAIAEVVASETSSSNEKDTEVTVEETETYVNDEGRTVTKTTKTAPKDTTVEDVGNTAFNLLWLNHMFGIFK